MIDLPDIHFGEIGSPPPDWKDVDDPDPDDEELEETPQGVIDMLGFDPKHMDDDEEESQPTGEPSDQSEDPEPR